MTTYEHGTLRRAARGLTAGALALAGCAQAPSENAALVAGAQPPQLASTSADVPAVGRVSALGTGCRKDTTDVIYTGENKGFTIRFADYALELNAGMSQSRMDRDCIISVEVLSPPGLRYAVTGLKYRGYAALEEGVTARQRVDYTFVGVADQGAPSRKVNELTGPWDDSFQFEDRVDGDALNWSDCATQRTLLLNTRLSLINTSPKREGYLSLSAIDADTSQVEITVDWKPCDAAP